MQNVSIS